VTVSLWSINTLGVDSEGDTLAEAHSPESLLAAVRQGLDAGVGFTVLGGGSNVVLRHRVRGTIVRCTDQTLEVLADGPDAVLIEVGAGYSWNALVETCINRGWYGIENLVRIPGTVGGAPVQHIGAYGVEIKNRLHSLLALSRHTAKWHEFSVEECDFSYRSSLFKTTGDWIISRVRLALSKNGIPDLSYPEVARQMAGCDPTAVSVAATINAIRAAKLPDPARIGNVGSFFKNPVISQSEAESLHRRCSWLQMHPVDGGGAVKLAAAQLIDRAGWKGYEENGVGVWEPQPLVLVNRGTRSGSAFLGVAEKIRTDLIDRYGVSLELEPVVLGQD